MDPKDSEMNYSVPRTESQFFRSPMSIPKVLLPSISPNLKKRSKSVMQTDENTKNKFKLLGFKIKSPNIPVSRTP